MPKLTATEVRELLTEPGILVRIGTVDDNGYPRVVPTWFILVDDDIVFTPRSPAAFLANIRRDHRVGLSIDEDALPYRKLTVQGDARIVHEAGEDDEWRDLYRSIAKRYVGEESADAYVDNTIDQPRALIAVSLANSTTSTWRMPVEGESGTGIWARRYYGDGTIMAKRADGRD
ncbi:MAG: pyridoxamine 5'-phosphate oxidase family protein [Acidimicrobiales bacterium]